MINCPNWQDLLDEEAYQDRAALGALAREAYEERVADDRDLCEFDLPAAQRELADRLEIERKADVVDLLLRFYRCTTSEPRFLSTYTEEDGSSHSGTGSLFDR